MKSLFGKKQAKSTGLAAEPQAAEIMKLLLTQHVKPYLKEAGFAKYGMTFYRTRADIIDVINFQGSQSNMGSFRHKFFVNCGMDSLEFQTVTRGTTAPKPNYTQCLYRDRMGVVTGGKPEYIIAEEYKVVDVDQFSKAFLAELQILLEAFAKVKTVSELVDLAITHNGLAQHKELCYYLAQKNDLPRLTAYIKTLHRMFSGEDDRWPSFAEGIFHIVGDYIHDPAIAKLLSEHAPPSFNGFIPPAKT